MIRPPARRIIDKGREVPVPFAPIAPVWGEDAKIYQKLPAFVADSLTDAWGNQLFDLWRQQNHLANADITPLDKLSFIGKRGMGALEFEPELSRERRTTKIDMKSLAMLYLIIVIKGKGELLLQV